MSKSKGSLARWVSQLWTIMSHTGRGYARPSMKHTGRGLDRRNDKLKEVPSIDEEGKPCVEFIERNESKLRRRFRTAVPTFICR